MNSIRLSHGFVAVFHSATAIYTLYDSQNEYVKTFIVGTSTEVMDAFVEGYVQGLTTIAVKARAA